MKSKKKPAKKKVIKKKKPKSKPKTIKMGREVKKALEQALEMEKASVKWECGCEVNLRGAIVKSCLELNQSSGKIDYCYKDGNYVGISIHQDGICPNSECRNEICCEERHLKELESAFTDRQVCDGTSNAQLWVPQPEKTSWVDSFMSIFGFRRKK
jgi:hypothetical protein